MSELLARPGAAVLLLLAPLAWALLLLLDRAATRRLDRLLGRRAPALMGETSPRRRGVRRALFVTGLFLGLFALLGPTWGAGTAALERRGIDLVVCLDVSRSMLAGDVAPDRLARARRELRALADRARGDRMGLVVFAGEARPLVPLTRDLRSFAALLDAADPLAVGRGGTDLGAALDAGLGLLGDGPGALLLLTDGEDLGGLGLAAAQRCRARGVPVYCAGLGTGLGTRISVAGGTFLKDRSGREVVSAQDAEGLRRIAAATGGTYVDAGAGGEPLLSLYDRRIRPQARLSFAATEERRRQDRYQWPLGLALLCWLLDLSLSRRRTRR